MILQHMPHHHHHGFGPSGEFEEVVL